MKLEEQQTLRVFEGADSRVALWHRFIKAAQVRVMAEIGVWKGDFAKAMLEQGDEIQRYYLIDPWANLPDWNKPFNVPTEMFDDIYEEAITKTAFAASRIQVLRGRTKEVIQQIPDNSLDFAYVDGDHTLRGITIDLIQLLPKIKEGGFIGGDDFLPHPGQHEQQYEPTLVCPWSIYFAEAMGLPIVALPFHQFLLQKRKGTSFQFIDTTGDYQDLALNKRVSSTARSSSTDKPADDKKLAYSYQPFVDTESIFVHVPKTAGVSVAKALFGNMAGGHANLSKYHQVFGDKMFRRYFKFTFIRNPWDRLFSAYSYLKKGGLTEMDRRWAEENLAKFASFDEFVREWVNPQNILTFLHFVPQVFFLNLHGARSVGVDFVGFF